MADISRLQIPSGEILDLKDVQARNDISATLEVVEKVRARTSTVLETQTVASGGGTVVWENENITENSIIHVYASVYGLTATNIKAANGTLTATLPASDADYTVTATVRNINTDSSGDDGSYSNAIENYICTQFLMKRTAKKYTVKIPKFASNPATICEKMDDNADLQCVPSTDTVLGRDDYADIPLFEWYNCNYKTDENGHKYPTALEGMSNYKTTGDVDVGVIQMTPFVKWDESADDYIILSITDSPTDRYTPWCTATVGTKTYPYVIHSKYFSGKAQDTLLRSQPNLAPARAQSYNGMIESYPLKGVGYHGAGVERNTWQIVFILIKYAHKNSQSVFYGQHNYNLQYTPSIKSSTKYSYFPVTNSQAAKIDIGSGFSVGYKSTGGSTDRSIVNMNIYADNVRVLKKEAIDDSNTAIYLDCDPFSTEDVTVSSTVTSAVYLSSMHQFAGATDYVLGHHDGSRYSNTNGHNSYRIQGVEYAVGGNFVSSDAFVIFNSDYTKDVMIWTGSGTRGKNPTRTTAGWTKVGTIPCSANVSSTNSNNDYWIGDISLDLATGAYYPSTRGSSSATGTGDYLYGGGNAKENVTREYLTCGNLSNGSYGGFSFLYCGYSLEAASWYFLSAD